MVAPASLAVLRALGLQLFPVEPRGKRPAVPVVWDGPKLHKFTDTDFVAVGPECNIGVACGVELPDGGYLTVIDLDVKPTVNGCMSWSKLADPSRWSDAYTIRTGSGGYHLYFRTIRPYPCRVGALPGVDVRGLKGYVVGPGSVHATGTVYEQVPESARAIPWAPDWVESWLTSLDAVARTAQHLTDAQLSALPPVTLTETILREYVAAKPRHPVSDLLARILLKMPISSPGNRHADIRLNFLTQLLNAFGPAVTFESVCSLLRADYPSGMTEDDKHRTWDAYQTARRKVSPADFELASMATGFAQEAQRAVVASTPARLTPAPAAPRAAEKTYGEDPVEYGPSYPDTREQFVAMWGALGLTMIKGEAKGTQANAAKVLRYFFLPRVRMNERLFLREVRDLPWAPGPTWATYQGNDNMQLCIWFSDICGWDISIATCKSLWQDILRDGSSCGVDTVREYLNALTWDGVPRLAHALTTYLGAADSELTRAYARCFFVSSVARAMDPGCRVDSQLTLVGAQGLGKTSFFRGLCKERLWYGSAGVRFGEQGRDRLMRLHKAWILEDQEITSHAGTENAKKAFMTDTADEMRLPYAAESCNFARRFCVVGTTNDLKILRDPTGSRRYHILEVKSRLDPDALAAERDQIWAEAVALYRSGAAWYLSQDEEALREAASAKFADVHGMEKAHEVQAEQDAEAIEIECTDVPIMRTANYHPAQVVKGADGEGNQLQVISFQQIREQLHISGKALTAAVRALVATGRYEVQEGWRFRKAGTKSCCLKKCLVRVELVAPV